MAKLSIIKTEYGVSAATRLEPKMAYRIAQRAERLGLTFCKMLNLVVVKGFHEFEATSENATQERRLKGEIVKLKSVQAQAIAQFVHEIATSDDHANELIDSYNKIHKNILLSYE